MSKSHDKVVSFLGSNPTLKHLQVRAAITGKDLDDNDIIEMFLVSDGIVVGKVIPCAAGSHKFNDIFPIEKRVS